MNRTDLFNFNLFNDENEKKQLPNLYVDYFFRIGSFLYGVFILHSVFLYTSKQDTMLFNDIVGFILGIFSSILFGIYLPIIFYINYKFYNRLIVSLSYQQESGLDVVLYDKQHLKISNYEIIYDWIEYALTFFLFIHKVEHYKNTWIFANENALYYTIKDLDTGILYLYCVNKEQYLNALEQEGKKRILTKTLK